MTELGIKGGPGRCPTQLGGHRQRGQRGKWVMGSELYRHCHGARGTVVIHVLGKAEEKLKS